MPRLEFRRTWPWLLFAVAMTVINNWIGWWGVRAHGHIDAGYKRLNPILTLLTLAGLYLARWRRPDEIGWRSASPGHHLLGFATGAAMGLPPALAFCFPVGVQSQPVRFDLIGQMSPPRFLWKILVELPLVTALWEELCFRGVLEGGLRRHLPPKSTAVISAVAFTLGHGAVHHYSLAATNVGGSRLPRPLAIVGMMLSVLVGGLTFSWLRHRTGSLWPPALAHWLVDAIMLTVFFVLGRQTRSPGSS